MTELAGYLPPGDLEGYLRVTGWAVVREDSRRAIWSRNGHGQVFVPRRHGPDWPSLLELALPQIAHAEGKDVSDIESDLAWRHYDVLHARRETGASGLSYQDAIALHEALYDLITAGARAAEEPRRSYNGRRPGSVVDYVDQLRAIPSMAGSFVVRALLPLSTSPSQPDLPLVGPASPNVRRISTMIVQAATAAVSTAEAVAAGGPLNAWESCVVYGVSSNLCDALSRLGRSEDEPSHGVTLRVDWTWMAPSADLEEVTIPAGLAPVLEAGADYLTGQPPEHSVLVTGLITKLHRETPIGPGAITVKGYVEGLELSSRSVRVELDADAYRQAIAAHDRGATVQVAAVVRREPRSLLVVRVEDFRVLYR